MLVQASFHSTEANPSDPSTQPTKAAIVVTNIVGIRTRTLNHRPNNAPLNKAPIVSVCIERLYELQPIDDVTVEGLQEHFRVERSSPKM
jgi:hypothetical protein